MKKILLSIVALFALTFSVNAEVTRSIGITAVGATVDSSGHEDIDNNGTRDTTKSFSNDVAYGSIFFEVTNDEIGPGSMTFGVDVIPVDAEFDSRSVTQTTIATDNDGTVTSGTNKGTGTVDRHITLYIQPSVELPAAGLELFATLGYVNANIDLEIQSLSSTNKTVSDSMNGIKYGIGVKRDLGGVFVKLEAATTDYDEVEVLTSNNTKVVADVDNDTISLSIGKSF